MKVLLDECVDVEFRKHLAGHDAFTVAYMRWKGLKNGDLLRQAAAAGFQAIVTTDRNVPYEQHVATIPIAVIILLAATNDLEDLLPLPPGLLAELNHAKPRSVTRIHPP
jgi:hypothetical protein